MPLLFLVASYHTYCGEGRSPRTCVFPVLVWSALMSEMMLGCQWVRILEGRVAQLDLAPIVANSCRFRPSDSHDTD